MKLNSILYICLLICFTACSTNTPKAPAHKDEILQNVAQINQAVVYDEDIANINKIDANTQNTIQNDEAFDVNENNSDFDDFDDEYKQEKIFDPLSGYNRIMTSINDKIYRYAFMPIFKAYDFIVPNVVQSGVSNFFSNLLSPVRFINNILQFKFENALDELFGFAVNSTIGLGGIFEVADSAFGIKKHHEDFGQTLGHWGIGSGFPIVLPLLGQSNLRDVFGLVGDFFVNPISYSEILTGNNAFDGGYVRYGTTGLHIVNEGSLQPDAYEVLTKDAIDLYPFLRNAYEQRRNFLIKE